MDMDTEFVNCPLVRHHRVLRHRLANHLIKCRRSLAQQRRAHQVHEGSWVSHNTYDEERASGEQWNTQAVENDGGQWSTQAVENDEGQCSTQGEEENWDDSASHPSYVPRTNHNFQKPPPFLSRNERKTWRLNHRKNF